MVLKESDELEFPNPADALFRAVSEAVSSIGDFRVRHSDGSAGRLDGTRGVGFWSAGEEIQIAVYGVTPGRSRLSISSESRMKTTVRDSGKNRRNIEDIAGATGKILGRADPVTAPGGVKPDMQGREREAEEELKPLVQLLALGKITPEEFEKAKARILAGKENTPCPACGASNPVTSGNCFNCGAILRGERFVCPDCGADLPSGGVTGCTKCGARFATTAKPRPPEKVYTGFWARLGAAVMDGFLVGLPVMLLSGILSFALAPASPADPSSGQAASTAFTLTLISGFAISWAYFAFQESSPAQATIGKRIIRARVTDLEGRRITLGRASGRWFGKILSAASLGLGFLMIGFSKRKQGLHDHLAGTLVMPREK